MAEHKGADMRPKDALFQVVEWTLVKTPPNRPGALIERCPADIREALKRLTSADAADVRIK